jgi:hypothetical protein
MEAMGQECEYARKTRKKLKRKNSRRKLSVSVRELIGDDADKIGGAK